MGTYMVTGLTQTDERLCKRHTVKPCHMTMEDIWGQSKNLQMCHLISTSRLLCGKHAARMQLAVRFAARGLEVGATETLTHPG
jgi:hypothetical protein